MHVCMNACMHACVPAFTYACMPTSAFLCMQACMHARQKEENFLLFKGMPLHGGPVQWGRRKKANAFYSFSTTKKTIFVYLYTYIYIYMYTHTIAHTYQHMFGYKDKYLNAYT